MKGNKTIGGVQVNLDHPDIAGAKDVEALKKQDLFIHLNEAEQKECYNELLKAIEEPEETAKSSDGDGTKMVERINE